MTGPIGQARFGAANSMDRAMAYAGDHRAQAAARRRPARPAGRDCDRPRRGGPRRRPDRLHAVAARPGAIAPDAPSLPITVGGVAFNVPPAAIRFKVQRRPGAQARVDLAFVWPSLDAARSDASSRCRPTPPDVTDRLFVTIAASDSTLAPAERLKAIYPRYRRRRPDRRGRRAQRCRASATARPTRARI